MNPNESACHQAEIGSANGITNAEGLAAMYAPLACGGLVDGKRLVSNDTLARMARTSTASHEDATLLIATRFGLGFMKSTDNRKRADAVNSSLIIGDAAFGHVGAGGSVGFADPECKLSFGYAMNHMGTGILMNPRGQSLIDSVYQTLGYNSSDSGAWISN
jgi:CubicO group peptidase (beta-lactamase class C family)